MRTHFAYISAIMFFLHNLFFGQLLYFDAMVPNGFMVRLLHYCLGSMTDRISVRQPLYTLI